MSLSSWFKGLFNKKRKKERAPTVPIEIPADETKPMWFELARDEIGVKEAIGPLNNPRIVEYHRATSLHATKDSVPWCASFVSSMLESCKINSTRSARARSYEHWGVELDEPRLGCIVVFYRGSKRSGKGHVGFYAGERGGKILVLGGNQGDAVNVSPYSKKRLLSYRWPNMIK